MAHMNPGTASLRRFAYVPELLDLELDESVPQTGAFPVPARAPPTVKELEKLALRDLYHEVSVYENEFSTWALVSQWLTEVWGGPLTLPENDEYGENVPLKNGVTVSPQSISVKEEIETLELQSSHEDTAIDLTGEIPFVKRIVTPLEAGSTSSSLREISSEIRKIVAKHEKDERERHERERIRLEEERREAERKELERKNQEEAAKAAAAAAAFKLAADREAERRREAEKQRIAQEKEETKEATLEVERAAAAAAAKEQETTGKSNLIVDCEPARQWNTLYSEWSANGTAMIQSVKSDSSNEAKQFRLSVKQAITLGVNQLSATHAQVARSSMNFAAALRYHEKAAFSGRGQAYAFSLALGATAIIEHSEGQIVANPPSVWSYAYLLQSVIAAHPSMQPVFDASILDRTCYVIPAYLVESQRSSADRWFSSNMGDVDGAGITCSDKKSCDDGTGSWGIVKGDSLLQYCQRTSGNVRLWLATCVVQQRHDALWKWFAQLVQLNHCTLASPFLLAAALDVAGWAALSTYKWQFAKLLRFLNSYYMPKLEELQRNRREATFLSASISHIRIVLDSFLSSGTLPVPEGYNLQEHCRPVDSV